MKKKKYKLRKWVKVSILVLVVFLLYQPLRKEQVSKTVVRKEKLLYQKKDIIIAEGKVEVSDQINIIMEQPVEEIFQNESSLNHSYTTRMTSYYSNDGYETGSVTGSGLGIEDFNVNNHGWYTYQGKLVIATATEYLLKYGYTLNEGVHTYRYYDEVVLNIDGIDYQAIVLDSCGSSMSNGRIDLFVVDRDHIKDGEVIVKE